MQLPELMHFFQRLGGLLPFFPKAGGLYRLGGLLPFFPKAGWPAAFVACSPFSKGWVACCLFFPKAGWLAAFFPKAGWSVAKGLVVCCLFSKGC